MSIQVQCPACQHAFAVADRFAGKKGKCPKCGGVFKAESRESDLEVFPEIEPAPALVVPAPKRLTKGESPRSTPPPPPPTPRGISLSDSGAIETFPTVPMGQAVPSSVPIGTPVATQPAFAVGKSDSGEHRLSPRKAKSSQLAMMIGGAVAGLAILGVILGVVMSMGGNDEKVAKKDGDNETAPDDPAEEKQPTLVPSVAPPPIAPAIDTTALAALRKRIFTLNITTAQGTTKASCFLVAERGYAVTAWHPLAQAATVEAVNADGIRIAVPGTSAVDMAHDLAIIKLEPTLPIALEHLDVAAADAVANSDAAAIDPASASAPVVIGKCKSVDKFAQLSPTLRARLKNVQGDWGDDTSIVQHALKLSNESVGAPVLNADGKTVGVHIFGDGTGGVAIAASHIKTLLESAGSEIKPFTGAGVASTDPPTPTPTPEPTPPTPTPTPENPTPTPQPIPDDPIDALIARIKEHGGECDKKSWRAKDAAGYAQFQLLGKFLLQAAITADAEMTPKEVKEKLDSAVREAMFSLTADKWPEEAAWRETNAIAAKAFEKPGEGVFVLARMVVPTSQGNMIGDVPIALVEIVGQSQMIVVPMASGGDKFSVDDQLLIVGMHDPGPRISFNNIMVPLVRSKYVLAVEKQD